MGEEKEKKEKKKAQREHQRIYIRRSIRKGGLKGIDKRVGSWEKKRRKEKRKQKPMDCVPWVSCIELIKTKPTHFNEVNVERVPDLQKVRSGLSRTCLEVSHKTA